MGHFGVFKIGRVGSRDCGFRGWKSKIGLILIYQFLNPLIPKSFNSIKKAEPHYPNAPRLFFRNSPPAVPA